VFPEFGTGPRLRIILVALDTPVKFTEGDKIGAAPLRSKRVSFMMSMRL
jgi:hypothetical protein